MPAPASQTRVAMTTTIKAANLTYFFMQDLLKFQYTLAGLRYIQTFLTFLWESSTCPHLGSGGEEGIPVTGLDARGDGILSGKLRLCEGGADCGVAGTSDR